MGFSRAALARAKRIRCLVLDVDGVLTDGRIVYDERGSELKYFDVQDGAGIVFWHRAGLKSAIITARRSQLVQRRAVELGVTRIHQRALRKLPVFEDSLKHLNVPAGATCVVGDDLMELPLMRRAGLAVAVSNAVSEVKAAAHYVTKRSGGRGAVREVVELILKAQGRWPQVLARYRVDVGS